MLLRVYVDEAGDRGVSVSSSRHFVVSAVVVADTRDREVRAELAELRCSLDRRPEHILHFVKLNHSQRLKAAQAIAGFSIAAIVSVVIHKDLIGRPLPADGSTHVSGPDPMYLWALRLLLERISWCVDDIDGTGAIVTFSRLKNFREQKLHDYRVTLEASRAVDIRWDIFDGHPFRISGQKDTELLQVADTAASALFKAIEPDRFGNTEPRYLRELVPKIYRRAMGDVTSYGLTTFPPSVSGPSGPLAFLRDF